AIMSEEKKCCFTGYRPHKFPFSLTEESAERTRFENKLYDAVSSLPNENCFKFYCGMASGFDIVAGETVAALKKMINTARVELIAVIPFKKQAESFEKEWQERYCSLLKKADKIVYVCEEYQKDCYQKRNHYMVDNSDIVITWFDGKQGGTAATLRYASKLGKKIVNLCENGVHEYDIESPYIIEDE
ncbi:MAG: DUF1273 family protein, partial [Clostridiales bacterium]|nr:DUF1273 family protein [Candidatus Equinaster intestinalis]